VATTRLSVRVAVAGAVAGAGSMVGTAPGAGEVVSLAMIVLLENRGGQS
jgi:hypothetical protein